MKKIITIILLTLSLSVFAEPPPPANAFKGVLYGYEVAIYVHPIFGSEVGLRTVYKVGSEWKYLSEPTFYLSDVDTQQKTDDKFIQLISAINADAYNELNSISLEPAAGEKRMQWLIENKLTIVNNELVVN